MNVLDKCYIRSKNWIWKEKNSFLSDERGVSGIVASIILVVVAVALAVIFWDKIKEQSDTLWKKVTDNVNKVNDIKPDSGT